MFFELKTDPGIKCFKKLIKKSLGEEANVTALSQEQVIECRQVNKNQHQQMR